MKIIENHLTDRTINSSVNNDLKGFEPYLGPRPYNRNKEDQKRFFGRDYETDEIVSLISSHKLVLIYAQSGAGKTSIFNAQVIPTLEQMGYEVLPSIRLKSSSNIIPNSDTQDVNMFIFNSLQSLKPELDLNILKDKSLTEFLHEYFPIKRDNNDKEMSQILIFDQLEELFDILPRNGKEQRKDFFKIIAQTLNDIIPLQIVFIIREDYLAPLDSYNNLLPEKLRPRFRLERLKANSALLALKGPLKKAPTALFQNYNGDIYKDIDNIVHELRKIRIEYLPGETQTIEGDFIEPIQLQICAKSWFEKVTNYNIKSLKQNITYVSNVDSALEEFYEDTIKKIINKGKVKESFIRKWCEENLITQAGTRSIVHISSDSTSGLKNDFIEIFEDNYFIKEHHRAGSRWCELTHDRLIQPIISSNQKWRKEQQKSKIKILKISIPTVIISIIIIYVLFESLYFLPPVESFPVGELPYILSVDPNSGLVYVINPKSDTISVINGKRNDLIKEIKVSDEPTDIAIDPKNNLIYTSHPKDKTISVIQRDNLMGVLNPFIKQIPIIEGIFDYTTKRSIQLDELPFSLAINPNHSKLYVTHIMTNNLSVIDTNNNKVIKSIKVGNFPVEVYFDSKFNKIYVANQRDNTVSVINGTNYDIIKTIAVGKSPSSMTFNPNDNKLYVANKGDNTVSVINGTNYDIVVSIFPVGNSPTSVSINEEQNILYVVNNIDHQLTAIDMGKNLMNHPLLSHDLTKNIVNLVMASHPSELVINKIPLGSHPSAITLDSNNNNNNNPMLYVANTDSDTVSVIDETKKEIIKQFKVGHKPRDIAIHTKNDMAYVSNSLSNTVSVINLKNGKIENIRTEGKYPTGLGVNEISNLVYVANTDSDTVSVINGTTNKLLNETIKVGNGPTGIAIDSVDSKNSLVYVTNYIDDTVSVINAKDQKYYGDINISRDFPGNGPTAIAVGSNNNKVYVLNMFSDNISVIDTGFIIDSLQNINTINPDQKYVTFVISIGDTPTDISLGSEEIYVVNRDHNISSIINMPIFNK